MTQGDAAFRAERLLTRLEAARGRLEQTEDPQVASEILNELAEIARDVELELERARQEADEVP